MNAWDPPREPLKGIPRCCGSCRGRSVALLVKTKRYFQSHKGYSKILGLLYETAKGVSGPAKVCLKRCESLQRQNYLLLNTKSSPLQIQVVHLISVSTSAMATGTRWRIGSACSQAYLGGLISCVIAGRLRPLVAAYVRTLGATWRAWKS